MRLRKAVAWAFSREGQHRIGDVIAALLAVYTALHQAGVV